MRHHQKDPIYKKIVNAHEKFRRGKTSARDLVRELRQAVN